ncbi:MAG TPA: hypothetical protein VGT03_08120 [Candidatus Acidoferrales bacterium]|nr:hypothetical protein [Candidatus Acidoferrales bacterium]
MPRAKLRTTKKGEKISIELSIREYEKLINDLDELDAIRAYDEAKTSGERPVPFDQVVSEVERSRK